MEKTFVFALVLGVFVHVGVLEPIPLAPLDLPCLEDSILGSEGHCICNYDSCFKPNCDYFLNLLTNTSDTPGSCCATYSCDACPSEEIASGKCPCPNPETYFDSDSKQCACKNPQKTLKDNACVCDTSKCPPTEPCDKQSVAIKVQDGCCLKTQCARCPPDSYPIPFSTNEMDGKCICYPCPKDQCLENQTMVVHRRGKTFPSMCCNLYSCEDIKMNNTCKGSNGSLYSSGESWIEDGCTKCKCNNGVNLCSPLDGCENDTSKPCLYANKVFPHKQVWYEDEDTCTQCTCNNGETKCLSHMCEVKTGEAKKHDDCPQIAITCKKYCPSGFKINKQGCEICKCKPNALEGRDYDKSTGVLEILREYNMTEADLKILLNDHFTTPAATTTTNEPTTIASAMSTSGSLLNSSLVTIAPGQECADNENLKYIVIGCCVLVSIFLVIGVCLLFKVYKDHRSRNSSLTISPSHNSYQPIKLCDANLNSEFMNPNKKYEMKVMSSIKAPI